MKQFVRSPKTAVEIYGEKFELCKPTAGQLKNYLLEVEEMKKDETAGAGKVLAISQKFLSSLGMKEDFIEAMEAGHVMELLKFLTETWMEEKKS